MHFQISHIILHTLRNLVIMYQICWKFSYCNILQNELEPIILKMTWFWSFTTKLHKGFFILELYNVSWKFCYTWNVPSNFKDASLWICNKFLEGFLLINLYQISWKVLHTEFAPSFLKPILHRIVCAWVSLYKTSPMYYCFVLTCTLPTIYCSLVNLHMLLHLITY